MLLGLSTVLLFVGMILDTISGILILTSLLLLLATSHGIDPYYFGIVMVVNIVIGFATLPVGVNLYVVSGISGFDIVYIAKKALPFIFIIALLVITFVPSISILLVG